MTEFTLAMKVINTILFEPVRIKQILSNNERDT